MSEFLDNLAWWAFNEYFYNIQGKPLSSIMKIQGYKDIKFEEIYTDYANIEEVEEKNGVIVVTIIGASVGWSSKKETDELSDYDYIFEGESLATVETESFLISADISVSGDDSGEFKEDGVLPAMIMLYIKINEWK